MTETHQRRPNRLALRIEHRRFHRDVPSCSHWCIHSNVGRVLPDRVNMNIAMALKAAGVIFLSCSIPFFADEPQLKERPPLPPNGATGYRVAQGQRIAVKFLNTLTTRGQEGDQVFLQTVFPVSAANRIVIPARCYIDAEVKGISQLDRVKVRPELWVRLGRV